MVAACVKHIVAQSIAWFYRPGTEPYREDAPLDVHASGLLGVSVEGVVALERSVLETSGVHGCVLRYGQLYGPATGSDEAAAETAASCRSGRLGVGFRARAARDRHLQRGGSQPSSQHGQGPKRARVE